MRLPLPPSPAPPPHEHTRNLSLPPPNRQGAVRDVFNQLADPGLLDTPKINVKDLPQVCVSELFFFVKRGDVACVYVCAGIVCCLCVRVRGYSMFVAHAYMTSITDSLSLTPKRARERFLSRLLAHFLSHLRACAYALCPSPAHAPSISCSGSCSCSCSRALWRACVLAGVLFAMLSCYALCAGASSIPL